MADRDSYIGFNNEEEQEEDYSEILFGLDQLSPEKPNINQENEIIAGDDINDIAPTIPTKVVEEDTKPDTTPFNQRLINHGTQQIEEREDTNVSVEDVGGWIKDTNPFDASIQDRSEYSLGEQWLKDNPNQKNFDIYEPTLWEATKNPWKQYFQALSISIPTKLRMNWIEEKSGRGVLARGREALLTPFPAGDINPASQIANAFIKPVMDAVLPDVYEKKGAPTYQDIFNDEENVEISDEDKINLIKYYETRKAEQEKANLEDPRYMAYMRSKADTQIYEWDSEKDDIDDEQ